MRSPFDLEQLHRLERMGWLAAGLTHDLNNALVLALAEIETLERLLGVCGAAFGRQPPHAAAEALDAAVSSVGNVRAALEATVAHSRDLQRAYRKHEQHGVAPPAPLDAAVEKAMRLVRPRVRAVMRLVAPEPGPAPVTASVDEGTLVRVIVNLLLNAADAYPPGAAAVPVEVRLGLAGPWSVCDVVDRGPGIAPGVLPRLFEPFVTAKPAGDGMGLGLFVSRHLLRAAGGDLRLLSTGPTGTTFRMLLPPGG